MLDLDDADDAEADTDSNVVMTNASAFVELHGTADRGTSIRATHNDLLRLAGTGWAALFAVRADAIHGRRVSPSPGSG